TSKDRALPRAAGLRFTFVGCGVHDGFGIGGGRPTVRKRNVRRQDEEPSSGGQLHSRQPVYSGDVVTPGQRTPAFQPSTATSLRRKAPSTTWGRAPRRATSHPTTTRGLRTVRRRRRHKRAPSGTRLRGTRGRRGGRRGGLSARECARFSRRLAPL